MKDMYEHINPRNGKWSPLLSDDVHEIIQNVSAEWSHAPVWRPPPAHPNTGGAFLGALFAACL